MMFRVSVPIRGLLNLTDENGDEYLRIVYNKVSVPIRGLLNLTYFIVEQEYNAMDLMFPSPSGDY